MVISSVGQIANTLLQNNKCNKHLEKCASSCSGRLFCETAVRIVGKTMGYYKDLRIEQPS